MKPKKTPHLSTILVALLLLAGLCVLLYPTANDLYTRWRLSKEVGQYNEITEAQQTDYTSEWAAAESYNQSLLEKESQFWVDGEEREYVGTLLNPLGTGMMGHITIPKINVNLPIYQGTDEQELQSGAGYWIGSSLPTGGASTHCIITAHTGLVKAKLFTDLDQLTEGDQFTLSILDRDMTYEVDQILITEPDDMSALYVVEGQDYVTLYTCYPYGINTQRLLVRGHRVEQMPEELENEAAPAFPWWTLLFIPALFIIAFAFRAKRKQPQGKRLAKSSRKSRSEERNRRK